jgi:uncharacterized protein (DUF1810 family)
VFGLGELGEREVGEKEVEEKYSISPVWFEERLEREKFKTWDPHVFHFFPKVRRKQREVIIFYNFTSLPLSSSWLYLNILKIANKWETKLLKVVYGCIAKNIFFRINHCKSCLKVQQIMITTNLAPATYLKHGYKIKWGYTYIHVGVEGFKSVHWG